MIENDDYIEMRVAEGGSVIVTQPWTHVLVVFPPPAAQLVEAGVADHGRVPPPKP
jgi:hypothetical protein